MGYIDSIVASTFKESDGEFYVFPFGVLGKGRRFRGETSYKLARNYYARTQSWMIPVIIATGGAAARFGWIVATVVVAVLLYQLVVIVPRITRNTDRVDVRDTIDDAMQRSGRQHSPFLLALMAVASAAFTVIGILIGRDGDTTGYLVATFFGVITAMIAAMLLSRRH